MRIDAIALARVDNAAATDVARGINRATATSPASRTTLDAPTTWTSSELEAFRVFADANRRTESGGVATYSSLRTTAGADYRASFGVAQLSVREHLARLSRLSDAALADLGTSRREIDAMRARGEAAAAFYHLLVDRRDVTHSAQRLELDDATSARVRTLAEARDIEGLRSLLGDRFAETTGLAPTALDAMMQTRALRDPSLRAAFLDRYAADHGAAFDPMHRDASRMVATARHLCIAHDELATVATTLGGDEPAYAAMAHYLGVGDSTENLLGWSARAAASTTSDERLATLLASVDSTTSHAREIENFERALAAVARIQDLDGDARIETLARIGRMFHGSPTHVREALFVDGRLDAPRYASRAELDASLDRLRAGRRWSDARLAEHVADVLRERRTS
jgi:uncharacterized protein YjiS (DUF1127 family)